MARRIGNMDSKLLQGMRCDDKSVPSEYFDNVPDNLYREIAEVLFDKEKFINSYIALIESNR